MASKAAISKHKKRILRLKGESSKFKKVTFRNRCILCGRSRGYINRFKMCRICFRTKALSGELPGVKKVSW